MNKLDLHTPAFSLFPVSYSEPKSIRRLIVLVSESEADITSVARKILELANALGSHVQFLGLYKDETREPSLRRQIVALSSMIEDGRISVESKIEFGGNWLDIIKSNWREGDVIACFAEQRAGLARRPLSQILESSLNATIYVLSGSHQAEDSHSNWIFSTMAWAGSIGVIAVFFWLQVKLTQLPQDWGHTSLLYLSLFVEVGLMWVWNSLF